MCGTRTPMALATALPMAAQMPTARRLAQSDHAAFVVLCPDIHVDYNVAHVADAGQLVELHIGVQYAAGLPNP